MFKLAVAALAFSFAAQEPSSDTEAVRAAVLDYVEGIYDVQPERIERSVHPQLVKRGVYFMKKEAKYSDLQPMTYEQLKELAANWNKAKKLDQTKAPKDIKIFEVLDQTASAKLTAAWGVDYFHLVKKDGKWWIMNIIWQTPPQAAKG